MSGQSGHISKEMCNVTDVHGKWHSSKTGQNIIYASKYSTEIIAFLVYVIMSMW